MWCVRKYVVALLEWRLHCIIYWICVKNCHCVNCFASFQKVPSARVHGLVVASVEGFDWLDVEWLSASRAFWQRDPMHTNKYRAKFLLPSWNCRVTRMWLLNFAAMTTWFRVCEAQHVFLESTERFNPCTGGILDSMMAVVSIHIPLLTLIPCVFQRRHSDSLGVLLGARNQVLGERFHIALIGDPSIF